MVQELSEGQSLRSVLEKIRDDTKNKQTVALRDVVFSLNNRSFGPLLLIPSLIMLTPVGAVPGIPLFAALFVILICVQIMFSTERPWFPAFLLNRTFSRDSLLHGINRILPWAKRAEKVVRLRWPWASGVVASYATAVLCIGLALSFIPLSLIPLAAAIPAAAVFLLGVGLTTRDGVVITLGLTVAVFVGWFLFRFWPF